jgi:hypothetical protein
VIARMEPGETRGPFSIEIPSAAISHAYFRARLTWWERVLERTPLERWVIRRNLDLGREALVYAGTLAA